MQKIKNLLLIFLFITYGILAVPFYVEAADFFIQNPIEYSVDYEILNKINGFRENPLEIASLMGITQEEMDKKNPSELTAIENGVPVLELDERLNLAIKDHLSFLVNSGHLTHLGTSHDAPIERAQKFGFEATLVGESLVMLAFENYLKPKVAVNLLLNCLIRDFFLGGSREGAPLLFPLYNKLGASLIGGQANIDGRIFNVYILGLLFGVEKDSLQKNDEYNFMVYGRVSQDKNCDGKPSSNEGILNVKVTLVSLTGILGQTWTWADGSYFVMSNSPTRPQAITYEKSDEDISRSFIIFDKFSGEKFLQYDLLLN